MNKNNARKKHFFAGSTILLAFVGLVFLFTDTGCGTSDINDSSDNTENTQVQLEAPEVQPGSLIVHNSCSKDLKIMVPPGKTITEFTVKAGESSQAYSLTDVGSNMGFKPVPITTDAECASLNCSNWAAALSDPTCHVASQWQGDNEKYAAYCMPAQVIADTCESQNNCCGNGMITNYSYGTFFEISIQAPNDTPDLSTNSNCSCSETPGVDQCVTGSFIFYNVPMKWTTNQDCTMGTAGKTIQDAECTSVTCPDAYTHPTDDKQVDCPNDNANRGYVIEYCPDNNDLPAI